MALIRSALTRSRSTSRGSVQEEMIDDDQEFISGADEVERAESGGWRIPFELGDADQDENLKCIVNDPLGQLILGLSQSFNALRAKTGSTNLPEMSIEDVCKLFADKVAIDTKNEEEVMLRTAKLAEDNMVEASMAYQVVMPKLRAPTHFSPINTLVKPTAWKEAQALFPTKPGFSGEEKGECIVRFLRTCNQCQKILNLSRADFIEMMTRSMTGKAWHQTSAFFDSGESIETVYQKLLTMYDKSPSPEESKTELNKVKALKTDTLQSLTARILDLATNAARIAGE